LSSLNPQQRRRSVIGFAGLLIWIGKYCSSSSCNTKSIPRLPSWIQVEIFLGLHIWRKRGDNSYEKQRIVTINRRKRASRVLTAGEAQKRTIQVLIIITQLPTPSIRILWNWRTGHRKAQRAHIETIMIKKISFTDQLHQGTKKHSLQVELITKIRMALFTIFPIMANRQIQKILHLIITN
jgi:hypothetical protein